MARQMIPLHHRDPRPASAPHRSPTSPTSAGHRHKVAEIDDYAAGTVDDYDSAEDQVERQHPDGAAGHRHAPPPDPGHGLKGGARTADRGPAEPGQKK